MWFMHVFIPNFLQFIVLLFILFASCVIIVQSDNIMDLLKEFSAVLVVSSFDDLLFFMAKTGYLQKDLFKNAKEIKVVKLDSWATKKGSGRITSKHILFLILGLLYSVWGVLVNRQYKGIYFKSEFPECGEGTSEGWWTDIYQNHHLYNDSICKGFLNKAKCKDSKQYPGCNGNFETRLGDGVCYHVSLNTAECLWDLGDCQDFNAKYPNCTIPDMHYFNVGNCTRIDYNTAECGSVLVNAVTLFVRLFWKSIR